MSANCPLCGSKISSMNSLRWQAALAKMPGPMKMDAVKLLSQRDRPATNGRWLYATRDGSGIVASPDQVMRLHETADYGEDLED